MSKPHSEKVPYHIETETPMNDQGPLGAHQAKLESQRELERDGIQPHGALARRFAEF
jgi:hypothetical protein